MNYIISEELRDRILSVAGSVLWSDMLQELRNLTHIKSGGVVTKEDMGDALRLAFMHGAKWWEFHSTKGTMWQSDQKLVAEAAERRYHGSIMELPAPTPQHEARGVDLSGVISYLKDRRAELIRFVQRKDALAKLDNRVMSITKKLKEIGDEGVRIDEILAHLQQAPQGVGNKEAGSDTTKAD